MLAWCSSFLFFSPFFLAALATKDTRCIKQEKAYPFDPAFPTRLGSLEKCVGVWVCGYGCLEHGETRVHMRTHPPTWSSRMQDTHTLTPFSSTHLHTARRHVCERRVQRLVDAYIPPQAPSRILRQDILHTHPKIKLNQRKYKVKKPPMSALQQQCKHH